MSSKDTLLHSLSTSGTSAEPNIFQKKGSFVYLRPEYFLPVWTKSYQPLFHLKFHIY